VDEWLALDHGVDTRRGCVGLGKHHGHCTRPVSGDLERRVLDGPNTRSLIRPGHESSGGSAQLIRRLGLLMGSIPGTTHW
jgi:hypothetical protein